MAGFRYRVRKRRGRWEVLRPNGPFLGPVIASRATLAGAMNLIGDILHREATVTRRYLQGS